MRQSTGGTPWRKRKSDEGVTRDTPWNLPYEGVSEKVCVVAENGCRFEAESASVQSLSGKQSPPEAPLHRWKWHYKPWVRLHVDYAGPFLGKMFLVTIDAHSNWMEAFPINTSTSSATIEKLRVAFATHGPPKIVVTDNGSNCTSKEFKDFLKQNGIRHIGTVPCHPASNGLAERAVQTFKEGMKKISGGSVETRVSRFLARYRITSQTSTGVSPAKLLLGRKPRSRLDLFYPEIGRKERQSQTSQEQAHDWHAKERTITKTVHWSNFVCSSTGRWTTVEKTPRPSDTVVQCSPSVYS